MVAIISLQKLSQNSITTAVMYTVTTVIIPVVIVMLRHMLIIVKNIKNVVNLFQL